MIETKSIQKPNEAAGLWLVKVLLGLLIIVILTIHLIVNHYIGEGAAYMAECGGLLFQSMDCINGNYFFDRGCNSFPDRVTQHHFKPNPSKGRMKIVDWSLYILGVVSVVYGIWLALRIASFSS